MAKQNIQTNLLSIKIKISEKAHDRHPEYVNSPGAIASVYLDKNGDPKYTIRLDNGILLDVYSHDFIT